MHAEDIKAAIRKNGVTPAQIARDHGVSKMAVSHVLHGNSKSARLAQAIAKAARMSVAQIWPGKYPQLGFVEKASRERRKNAAL
jgi:gp16 family phage-associated protein